MKKPNIVFIMSDDQGSWAMRCAGTPEIFTPNIDSIFQNGMMFSNFFCASPVCSPARASLLTGKMPSAHGILDWLRSGNVDGEKFKTQGEENPYGKYSDEKKPIQYLKGQTTYTDILTQNGYTCALSGKWHLGDSINPQHGFKYWYTIGKGGCFYYHPDIVEHGNIKLEHGKYVTDLITDKAVSFIEELSQKEEPFYLSVHYTAPHSPWEADQHPKEYIDMYDKCKFESIPDITDHPHASAKVYGTDKRHENLRGYFAAITAMDDCIGRILKTLITKEIEKDTIVIFAGDNGMNMGHHGIWGKGNGTFPMNMYDTSVKVPFIFSYPGVTPKGTICKDMVSAYDFFPTLMDILEVNDRCTLRIPGHSFADLLGGETRKAASDVVVYDEYGPVRMIRTDRYKYVHRYPYGYNELYDLEKDPGEENNIVSDPINEPLIVELRARMEKWFTDYSNPDINSAMEGVTGRGQLCSAGIYAEYANKYA